MRRLAAIFTADVVGYSRLMGADEEGTLDRLKAHRRELVDPKIEEYHGRIFKTTGDGLLAEFPSVVDAVRCAVEIQRGMIDRNTEQPEERRITFRIGINLGDVIIDGDDVYGDGVNIAARLETLAAPGGVTSPITVLAGFAQGSLRRVACPQHHRNGWAGKHRDTRNQAQHRLQSFQADACRRP